MTRPLVFLLALALAVFALASCSFTTAGNFKECTADVDCGTLAACSSGYCLPLPDGCRREEAGGMRKAFEETNRIPLVALLPIGVGAATDDSEVQSANALKLAISEANDRLSSERGFFGLFVCNTDAPDASLAVQGPWFITNLKVPAMFVSSSGPTQTMALGSTRKDAGTLIISPNATNPELTTVFSNDGNVWRVAPPDNFQAEVMSRLGQPDPDAGPRGAILAPTPAYGQGPTPPPQGTSAPPPHGCAKEHQQEKRGGRKPDPFGRAGIRGIFRGYQESPAPRHGQRQLRAPLSRRRRAHRHAGTDGPRPHVAGRPQPGTRRAGRADRRGREDLGVTLVIDDIGLLVTNDPELGEGPLGIVRNAALVIDGDRVAVLPGLRDGYTGIAEQPSVRRPAMRNTTRRNK